jgi:cystathionine beta-lyase family protein involved in aluminum resistance
MENIKDNVKKFIAECEAEVKDIYGDIDTIAEYNQYKVLKAMQENRLSDAHFNWNTGYGYNDMGRETIEQIYADIFKAEDAIVRPLIVNGTHALTLCITGLLFGGDHMISIAGKPYDTLDAVIGINDSYPGNLKNQGVEYTQIDLLDSGEFNKEEIKKSIKNNTKMIYIQRSSGYSWRKSLTINDIEDIIKFVKDIKEDLIVMIDNCYGEFLDKKEPIEVGADIMAGSLIKNPGGGLALAGGYIVGKRDLIELVSFKMTSPGIGKECGLMFGQTRSMLQGLFMAPTVVSGAIKGAILCARTYEKLGFEVNPSFNDYRSDIIQSIKFKEDKLLIEFCRSIQFAAPVDSFVTCEPWDMPGYDSPVIMAAGAFVQGSSIELSADGPIRAPYIAYFQGGLTYFHSKYGVMKSVDHLLELNLIEI